MSFPWFVLLPGGAQTYQHVGTQHLILPEPVRYLTDRFVSANVNVPEVDELVRISPKELYGALEENFPLGVFELSYLTSAIRGFLHHFYPAYDTPLVDYSQKVGKARRSRFAEQKRINQVSTPEQASEEDVWGKATSWLTKRVPAE